MASAAVESSFDVAYWFVDRALNDNEYIQPQKLHRLMFLSQAYFAVAYNGRPLMPAVFVADQFGPIEPNVFRACSIQRPPIETVPLSEAVSQFLDSVWRRFGSQSANSLSTLVNGHAPYRDAIESGPRTEITLTAMVKFYGRKPAPAAKGESPRGPTFEAPALEQVIRPKIMVSQDGKPVAVKKWTPKGAG
jgi:uncharacterized phage-associated protein